MNLTHRHKCILAFYLLLYIFSGSLIPRLVQFFKFNGMINIVNVYHNDVYCIYCVLHKGSQSSWGDQKIINVTHMLKVC